MELAPALGCGPGYPSRAKRDSVGQQLEQTVGATKLVHAHPYCPPSQSTGLRRLRGQQAKRSRHQSLRTRDCAEAFTTRTSGQGRPGGARASQAWQGRPGGRQQSSEKAAGPGGPQGARDEHAAHVCQEARQVSKSCLKRAKGSAPSRLRIDSSDSEHLLFLHFKEISLLSSFAYMTTDQSRGPQTPRPPLKSHSFFFFFGLPLPSDLRFPIPRLNLKPRQGAES